MGRKWATFAVLLCLLAGGSALVVLLGGDSEGTRPLQLERFVSSVGRPELLVTVPEEVNVPETAGGASTVGLECRDGGGAVVLSARHGWPIVSDGDPPAPHIHQPAAPQELDAIATCRLTGTDPRLEGELGLGR